VRKYLIHPLVVGANETDQGVMTYLKGYGKRIWIPIYVFYLAGGPEKILVDTGLEQFVVPAAVGERYGLKIQEFEEALGEYALKPEDIDIIIHTHLHNGHCENDYQCTNARVYVQRREYEFFKDPHPVDHRYFPDLLDQVAVVPVEGDQEIVEGVQVLLTPGHTVGGQSVGVNTRRGRAVIPASAAMSRTSPPPGRWCPRGCTWI
jgi:N-acyl homoserine lactone hydrolase